MAWRLLFAAFVTASFHSAGVDASWIGRLFGFDSHPAEPSLGWTPPRSLPRPDSIIADYYDDDDGLPLASKRRVKIPPPGETCVCLGSTTRCTGASRDEWPVRQITEAVCPVADDVKRLSHERHCNLTSNNIASDGWIAKNPRPRPCPPLPESNSTVKPSNAYKAGLLQDLDLMTAIVAVRAASTTMPLWKPPGTTRKSFYTTTLPGDNRPSEDTHIHNTCAVVGNSGMILTHEHAPLIDAKDFVLRINQAPTIHNFAIYTGLKTSARILSRKFTRIYATTHPELLSSDPGDVQMISTGAVPKHSYGLARIMQQKGLSKPLWAVNQDAFRNATRLLHLFRDAFEVGSGIRYNVSDASTGFVAVQLASQLCKKVTVYGFSLQLPGDCKGFCSSFRYFNAIKNELPTSGGSGAYKNHQFDVEGYLLKAYHILGWVCIMPPPKGLGQCGSRFGRLAGLIHEDGSLATQWPSIADMLVDSKLREVLDWKPKGDPAAPRQHELQDWVSTPGIGPSTTVNFVKKQKTRRRRNAFGLPPRQRHVNSGAA